MTKYEYRKAQDHLIEEAMEGDLCSIEVYPAQNKPPVFAHAAMADCIMSLEALIKQHATTDPEALQIICGSFGVALANAATTYKGEIIHCDDDEVLYDYSVEEISLDED